LQLNRYRVYIKYCFQGILLIFLATVADAQVGNVIYVHDPSIIKVDGDYYIFSTGYGYGIPMRRSGNLYDWQWGGSVFNAIPAWAKQAVPGVNSLWAPDISYRDSTFYLYYSVSTFGSNRSCIGLATNTTLNPDDPDYAWVDQGEVICSNYWNNWNAIDPNLVEDDSGRVWLAFGSFWSGIKMRQLDPETMKPDSANTRLYSLARRPSNNAIEAPFIIRKYGYYYLFASIDYCCNGSESTYKVIVGRSSEVTGPYVDRSGNEMLNGGGTLLLSSTNRWRGPGHNSVLLDSTGDWIVYHAYDAQNNGRPTLHIRSLNWTEDQWPTVGDWVQLETEPVTMNPTDFTLFPNYPNPFNLSTRIGYELPRPVQVNISIYDIRGRLVTNLVNERMDAGYHTVVWEGNSVSSGVYFYRLTAGEFTSIRKMILVK